jgi:excisionase family DNA binding protein
MSAKAMPLIKATYSLAEVARLLGRPPSTVYRWADKGALTTIQIHGQRLVPLAALKAHGLVFESILAADKMNRAKASVA